MRKSLCVIGSVLGTLATFTVILFAVWGVKLWVDWSTRFNGPVWAQVLVSPVGLLVAVMLGIFAWAIFPLFYESCVEWRTWNEKAQGKGE